MKPIPKEYFATILDRLTRFEPAYMRYKRVYSDIINKFAPELKTHNATIEEQISAVEEIFEFSGVKDSDFICELMRELEDKYFIHSDISNVSYQYLSSRVNFSTMLAYIGDNKNLPKNLIWLKNISQNSDLSLLREEKSLLYPIEKILLCEGETERIVLSTILKMFNYNLDKMGVLLVAAGGKNQVARKYYSMIEYTKLPFFILLDRDASSVKHLIENKLRDKDKIYLIKSGEFEDLIPPKILIDTLNFIHNSEIQCKIEDFDVNLSSVINLENISKKYGFGEFKKAHFAHGLKEYIEKNAYCSDFSESEISEIIRGLEG